MEINKVISLKRKSLGLTMRQVADAVGVSEGTISRWESGDIKNMRREKIDLLAKILKISPDELIHGDKIQLDIPPREIEEAIITCPICGYNYSHYIRTVGVNFNNEKSSGFAIEFRCEGEPEHTFYWIIESYKGNTYVIVTDERDDIDILKRFRLEEGFINLAEVWNSEDISERSVDSLANEYGSSTACEVAFSKLNFEGQKKALEYIQDLSSMEKYKK